MVALKVFEFHAESLSEFENEESAFLPANGLLNGVHAES